MIYEQLFDKLSKTIEVFAKEKGYTNSCNLPGSHVTYVNFPASIELIKCGDSYVKVCWNGWWGNISMYVELGYDGFPSLYRCSMAKINTHPFEALENYAELFGIIQRMLDEELNQNNLE